MSTTNQPLPNELLAMAIEIAVANLTTLDASPSSSAYGRARKSVQDQQELAWRAHLANARANDEAQQGIMAQIRAERRQGARTVLAHQYRVLVDETQRLLEVYVGVARVGRALGRLG